MPHPMIGKPAPPISLPDTKGQTYTVPIGQKPVAVFFFPKAGTAVCTAQACSFRDAKADSITFKRYPELEVVGISADSTSAQASFADTNNLEYPILSDPKDETRKAYKVSRDFFGLAPGRETFFIDTKGIVRGVCESALSGAAHAAFVEKILAETEGGTK
ncbi:thioredoxin-like protein [Papiliotrema laurentii]|uniref:thioredoxin-dependent peroxiredoxin n=1 Tax=Papiliotrema laurentii TaxID=5418 RepID=A0AAD9CX81_PAPLA|nr:thioredoxin-like protein [Papiliotrema laurentii]